MLRRTADDAGLDLPVRVGERYRWVPLTKTQQIVYDQASQRIGLSAHAKRERLGRVHEAESSLVDALITELGRRPGEKVVIYCETLDVVQMVSQRLDAGGTEHRVIEQRAAPRDRDVALDDFKNDPNVNVLVASRVIERGLDLEYARVLYSLDSSFNSQRERQREGRLRRIGSPHATFEHVTLLPDTPLVRQKVDTLSRKESQAASLLTSADDG